MAGPLSPIQERTKECQLPTIYLHGGGDSPEHRAETFGRFVAAAAAARPCRLALVAVDESQVEAEAIIAGYRAAFEAVGLSDEQLASIVLSPSASLGPAALAAAQPSGVFVCGGATPAYQAALCADRAWVDYLDSAKVVYGGSSAGAMIAADMAIIGGWQVDRGGQSRQVIYQSAGEGLEHLSVRPGLGLTRFAIDAHASQRGTLARLIHTVELGLTSEGLAIDEDTLAVLDGAQVSVYGRGHTYRVFPCDGAAAVSVLTGG
jgi:cyanophycinase